LAPPIGDDRTKAKLVHTSRVKPKGRHLSERIALPAGSLFDRARFNVAPTTPIAAIRESRDGGRELVALKWGLIPSWSRDGKGFINARSETAAEKPTFRSAFKKRRC